jgi:hypothetical protein
VIEKKFIGTISNLKIPLHTTFVFFRYSRIPNIKIEKSAIEEDRALLKYRTEYRIKNIYLLTTIGLENVPSSVLRETI